MKKIKIIEENLKKYSQEHLLRFYNELNCKEKQSLISQIEEIDFEQINKMYEEKNNISDSGNIEPINYVDKLQLVPEQINYYYKLGEKIIKNNEFAFLCLAGGQGTRLGHDGPKGTYILDINSPKSLFEIMADSLKEAKRKFDVYIPWYIMTSRENNDDTVAFFHDNNYFGYPESKVVFFKQGELPMVDINGKILLENKYTIKKASDGHGGIFYAMYKNNIISDMKSKNIKWCFIGGIDNVLLKMVDPVFIGMAEESKVKVASKSLLKASPKEKVGVFCQKNGRPFVIEYSEITDEMANLRDGNGNLIYGESHILCNLFSIDALSKIEKERLPYHAAFKKSNFIDERGNEVIPSLPNAYKFEAFIFDAFSKFDDMLIYRVLRENEFAPIKNKSGEDSPESAIKLYNNYFK